jgi:acetyltransferase-like isoleucine patch superfamily enzyme
MPKKSKAGTVGPRTRVRDRRGLWGEYRIGDGVRIGDRVKVEAFAFLPPGVVLEDDASVGPHACFTNDKRPKAVGKWKKAMTLVQKDASIGANATVVCGVTGLKDELRRNEPALH